MNDATNHPPQQPAGNDPARPWATPDGAANTGEPTQPGPGYPTGTYPQATYGDPPAQPDQPPTGADPQAAPGGVPPPGHQPQGDFPQGDFPQGAFPQGGQSQAAPGYAPPGGPQHQAAPGYAPPPANQPYGAPGYPQGVPGYPQGAPGYPQGAPGYPYGAPGYAEAPAWQPPRPYNHGLRREQGGNAWRGIVTIILMAVSFLVLQIPASVVILLESDSLFELSMTPMGLAATNLALAAMWPVSLGIQRMLYGPGTGTLHSVAGKIRWPLFFVLAGVLVPAYILYIGLNHVLFPAETGPFTATAAAFIVVAILTTPFQSAGEEVAFRGLLPRAIGGWFASHRMALVVGTLISTVLFAAAHGAGDWWLNGYYAVFGVCMAVMTWRTQGLEAAIIAHAANNTFLMVLNAALGMEFDDMFEREAGAGGPFMLVGMGMCVLVTVLVWWRTGKPKAREAMELPGEITPNP